jgi:hypothetical protein
VSTDFFFKPFFDQQKTILGKGHQGGWGLIGNIICTWLAVQVWACIQRRAWLAEQCTIGVDIWDGELQSQRWSYSIFSRKNSRHVFHRQTPCSRYCPLQLLIELSSWFINYVGIRSFGATDADKAVIEFGKPLTLITGQNGAGKTVNYDGSDTHSIVLINSCFSHAWISCHWAVVSTS